MTVAAIHVALDDNQFIEVTFNESARYYRISKNVNHKYFDLLQESQQKNKPVLIKRRNEYSDIILSVRRK